MSSLYQLTENYNNILELADNPEVTEDMIKEALDSISEEIELKAVNIAKLIKSIESDIAGVKAEKDRLAAKEKSMSNKVKNLKEYLYSAMKLTGKEKIKTDLFSFNIQKNPASVNVISDTDIPEEFLVEMPKQINKKAILEKLKAGETVPGCELQQTTSLRIK